jgi:hypothetical protein
MNILEAGINFLSPILTTTSQDEPSQGHLSPRSPLECDYDDQEGEADPSKVHAEGILDVEKIVRFPPLPPKEETTPESTSTVKTVDTWSSSTSQDEQSRTMEHAPSPTPTHSASPKRKIQWAKRVKVKEIRHLFDIPTLERDGLWMSISDQQMNKAMVRTTVTMMMRGEVISEDDPDFCTRGLECRTKAGSKARNRYKLRVRSAVLNEQDLQREEGIVDPDFIAMASMDESSKCREAALRRGEQDAICIEKYLEETRLEFRGFHR